MHFLLLQLLPIQYGIHCKSVECGIYGSELILDMERQICEMGLYNHVVPGGGILGIEQTLLDLGSNPEVTSGMFYLLPIYADNKLFLR